MLQTDFDQYPKSKTYTEADLEADWKKPFWSNGVAEGRASIVLDDEAGGVLAIRYPANKLGSKETGAQWKYYFAKGYEEAELSYRVQFVKGFDFVRGGKLPGLASGTAPTGKNQADGLNGWSARLMWRDKGAAIAYTQHMHSGKAGDGKQEDKDYWQLNQKLFRFEPGRWYQINQRIRLNQPDQKDGVLIIKVEGDIVLDRRDIQFRKTDQLQIDKLYFSTFFGGADSTWNTRKDETILFDDFKIIGRISGSTKISSRPNMRVRK